MSKQPLPNEQLASLLIDGELKGKDLALANERLKSDADFAAEVESLRRQRAMFKSLPAFKTSAEFSQRVLESSINQVRAIVGDESFVGDAENKPSLATKNGLHAHGSDGSQLRSSSNASTGNYSWRTAVSAVACLAGMIMLTLFVFPQNGADNSANVAMVTESGSGNFKGSADEKTDSKTAGLDLVESAENELQKVEMDETFGQSRDEELLAKTRASKNGGVSKGDFDDGSAVPSSNQAIQLSDNMFRGDKLNSGKGGGAGLGGGRGGAGVQGPGNALAANSENSALPPLGSSLTLPGGFSGTPMTVRTTPVVKSQPVEQIWCVDMDNPGDAIASVGRILATNRIEVQYGQGAPNAAKQATVPQQISQPNVLANQPGGGVGAGGNTGFEAFYVNATSAQMKQALLELSDQANISNMPIALNSPVNQLQDAMEVARADMNDGDQQQSGLPPSVVMQNSRALAQQLMNVPLNRAGGQREVPPIPDSNDPALNPLVQASPQTSLAMEEESSSKQSMRMKSKSAAQVVEGKSNGNEIAADSNADRVGGLESGGMSKAGKYDADAPSKLARGAQVPQAARRQQWQPAVPAPTQSAGAYPDASKSAYFDSWISESDQQMRQFLILVRTPKVEEVLPAVEAEVEVMPATVDEVQQAK